MFERFLTQGIHLTCDDDVDAAWRAWNVCSPPPLGLSHRLLKAHQSVITESGIADRFFLFKKDLEGAAKSRDVPTPVISPVGRTAGVERWAPPCYRLGLENTGPSRPSPFVAARRSRRPLGGVETHIRAVLANLLTMATWKYAPHHAWIGFRKRGKRCR